MNIRRRSGQGALVSVLAIAISGGAAHAATQGSLGSTSTGNVSISASVAQRVQITGLNDVVFTNVDPGTAVSSAQNICVWSNGSTKGYNITATGSGASNAFTLSSAALPVAAYTVEYAGSSGQTSGTALTAGTALTGLTSTATHATCSTGPSATGSLIVKMSASALQGMTAGASYTGTLTLVVAAE